MSTFTTELVPYGTGFKSAPGALADKTLLERLARYKRTVAKRYRVLDPDFAAAQLPKGKLWISTKVDGELWFVVKRGKDVALVAYNGRVLQGGPLGDELAKLLAGAPDLLVAGELFAVPKDGARPRVGHVAAALGDPALADTLGFKAFDLVEDGETDAQAISYEARWARISAIFGAGRKATPVTTIASTSAEDAATHYREWVGGQKFEGIVVRSEQGLVFKVKPTFTIDAVVVAFGERITGDVQEVRELTVALRRDDGALHVLGTVGNGFGEDGRVTWHKRLSAMQASSSFRMANREGTLCRWVKPEIVVEVRCSDLIDTDSTEGVIRRMALRYDDAAGYTQLGLMPIASMVHPVYLRERTDKLPDVGGIGLEQIHARLPFEARDEVVTTRTWKAATVVRRVVWTKAAKGQTAVRKYVMLATNKAAEDPTYPPFVAHFTDYSAGRADPLKTSLVVASTLEKLEQHVAAWVEENVKRGWTEVGAAPAPAAEPVEAAPPKKKATAKKKAEAE